VTKMAAAEASRTAATSAHRQVALLVVGVALLQACWIAVVPPFRGSDEFDHAYRASAVANGQWRATQVPEDGRGLLVDASSELVEAAHAQCDSLSYTGPDNCSAVADLGAGRVLVASGAANYNPAFYWVLGKVASISDGAAALYLMRITGASLCLLFIGLAAWAFRSTARGTWAFAGLVIALSPVMVFSTVIAAPNGLEMASALALWSSLLNLGDAPTRSTERVLLVIAFAAASVLVTLRLLGPLFALLIVLTTWVWDADLVGRAIRRHRRVFVTGSALVLSAIVAAVTWVLWTGSMSPAPEKQGAEWSFNDLVLWPLQAIAAFPYRDQPGAMIVYPVVLLIFSTLVVAALRLGTRRDRVAVALTLVVSMGMPVVITALTYGGRGAMWQGRYGLPYSLGIVLVAAMVLDRQLASDRWRRGLPVIAGVMMAAAWAACVIKVLDGELARSVSSNDPAWHAPSAVAVGVGVVLGWVLLTLSVVKDSHASA